MASAFIVQIESGVYVTRVFNSEGEFVKEIPTDPSQIRKERKSMLFKPALLVEPAEARVKGVALGRGWKEQLMRRRGADLPEEEVLHV